MTTTSAPLTIAIPLYPGFTALDAVGPYEVLQCLPNTEVTFVGEKRGPVRADLGRLAMMIDATFDELPEPNVIVIPGGDTTHEQLHPDGAMQQWVAHAHKTSTFTTSVCTGSLVLAAAGLLEGLTATTYWNSYGHLEELGAIPVDTRVVEHLDQRLITSAGVSSGIDMALRLAEILFDTNTAKAMQLLIEYDPQPPFDAGHVGRASGEVMKRVADFIELKV